MLLWRHLLLQKHRALEIGKGNVRDWDWSSLKTSPARKTWTGFFKSLQQLIHINLFHYFFRTDSAVLMSITYSLLALYFVHEIMETSYIRLIQEISFDKHTHTHNHFTALWNLSGTTRMSRYQKKHSPTTLIVVKPGTYRNSAYTVNDNMQT